MTKKNNVKNNPFILDLIQNPTLRRLGVDPISNKQPTRIVGLTPDLHSRAHGFTLIELLVVVLIIGVLAAVALPQYQKAVEKARMVEAVVNVRAIANAHQLYHLETGSYLPPNALDQLMIKIPGTNLNSRTKTTDFVYSPNGCGTSCSDPEHLANYLALAIRVSAGGAELYKIWITQSEPGRLKCNAYIASSAIQEKLCNKLNQTGEL